jgi:hypothetical protein
MSKTTLHNLDNAIASYKAADKATGDGNKAKAAATRSLYLAGSAHFASDKTFTADAMLARIYPTEDAMPKGAVLSSRKTEWNSVREATLKAGVDKVASLYDDKTGRQKFIDLCVFVKNTPKATADQIEAARKEKPKSNATAGDILADMVAAAFKLADDHRAVFDGFKVHLAAIQTKFDTDRAAGKLPFRRELEPKGEKKATRSLASL